jgi:hypothetical protein
MNKLEAQQLAQEIASRYQIQTFASGVKLEDSSRNYGIVGLYFNKICVTTVSSREGFDALRGLCAVIFPIDEEEEILKQIDTLPNRYQHDNIDDLMQGFYNKDKSSVSPEEENGTIQIVDLEGELSPKEEEDFSQWWQGISGHA